MPEIPSSGVIVVGGGPVALLTALELYKAEIPVTLVEADFQSQPPPENPELAYLWGDEALPALFSQSLALWRTLATTFQLPAHLINHKLLELSTSPGREEKLKQEALLEALGGEPVTFTATIPAYLNRQTVSGGKSWPTAPYLAPGILPMLQDAVTARAIPTYSSHVTALNLAGPPPLTLALADGATLQAQHVVVASAAAAKRLLSGTGFSLPLRPARGHTLVFNTPGPEGMPLLLHRLKRGHLFLVPMANQTLHAHYDALLDPNQATTRPEADPALVAALAQHLANLLPSLAGQTPTSAATSTHWLTPDFLPALGPWQAQPTFILAVGFNGREYALAPAVANQLARHLGGEDVVFAPEFTPNRFATGLWTKVGVPGSLNWNETATGGTAVPLIAPEYMTKVNTVEKAEAQYASNVKQVEKVIITAEKKIPEVRERNSKPKIQTAGLKK